MPADVSLEAVRAELPTAGDYAAAGGLVLDSGELSALNLRFYVTFLNRDRLPFVVEFDCRDYPLYPPTVEFVSQDRRERALKRLYPMGFHPTPCVCMRYNRRAYTAQGGPHADWRLLDWRLPTGTGIAIDSLALMVSDLDSKIRQSTGRMA